MHSLQSVVPDCFAADGILRCLPRFVSAKGFFRNGGKSGSVVRRNSPGGMTRTGDSIIPRKTFPAAAGTGDIWSRP